MNEIAFMAKLNENLANVIHSVSIAYSASTTQKNDIRTERLYQKLFLLLDLYENETMRVHESKVKRELQHQKRLSQIREKELKRAELELEKVKQKIQGLQGRSN